MAVRMDHTIASLPRITRGKNPDSERFPDLAGYAPPRWMKPVKELASATGAVENSSSIGGAPGGRHGTS
jgi:hypothetical protein